MRFLGKGAVGDGQRSWHRRRPGHVWLSLVLLFSVTLPLQSASAAPQQLLPDLGMARLTDFRIRETGGERRLRFTSIIVNVGRGPLQVIGHDRLPNDMLQVDQQILRTDGNWDRRETGYRMFFAGDGHNHWHVRNLERYVLKRVGNANQRTGEKHGFCFFDNHEWNLDLPGAPQEKVYSGCGDFTDPEVTAGISVGWADRYSAGFVNQYIIIDGLPDGRYTLSATADALGMLRERCEGNNRTIALIRIRDREVRVLDPGKNSKPC
jgi:hypothetical protein